jgi:hypothetical protein
MNHHKLRLARRIAAPLIALAATAALSLPASEASGVGFSNLHVTTPRTIAGKVTATVDYQTPTGGTDDSFHIMGFLFPQRACPASMQTAYSIDNKGVGVVEQGHDNGIGHLADEHGRAVLIENFWNPSQYGPHGLRSKTGRWSLCIYMARNPLGTSTSMPTIARISRTVILRPMAHH